jgi:hypothetical protein
MLSSLLDWQLPYERNDMFIERMRYKAMPFDSPDTSTADLKQLWGGGQVPPLTPEQTALSLKLWQKIQTRKEREQKVRAEDI